jgi:hypothetical protein
MSQRPLGNSMTSLASNRCDRITSRSRAIASLRELHSTRGDDCDDCKKYWAAIFACYTGYWPRVSGISYTSKRGPDGSMTPVGQRSI